VKGEAASTETIIKLGANALQDGRALPEVTITSLSTTADGASVCRTDEAVA
jgi:hypothetical protein